MMPVTSPMIVWESKHVQSCACSNDQSAVPSFFRPRISTNDVHKAFVTEREPERHDRYGATYERSYERNKKTRYKRHKGRMRIMT